MILDYKSPIVPGGNFTWAEYALLKDWNCYAIPTEIQKQNAEFLFAQLQTLREELGKPIVISSGARTGQYTRYLRSKKIPAALASAHLDWRAVDVTVPGMATSALWRWFDKRWPGRMENLAATPGWVHLDTRNWGKRTRFSP